MRTVRAWAGVHHSGPAAGVIVVVALASLFFADTFLESMGPFRFLAPVSTLLLLPALAGIGAAVACTSSHGLPLPDPARAHAARAAWALAWTGLAILVANLGLVLSADISFAAVTRNVIVYTALSLIMASIGRASLAWAPVIIYTVAVMIFGYPAHADQFSYYWWAVVLKSETTTRQAVASVLFFVVGLSCYVFKPGRRLRR